MIFLLKCTLHRWGYKAPTSFKASVDRRPRRDERLDIFFLLIGSI